MRSLLRTLFGKLEGPQFVPFTFKGHEGNPVFIHANCGTIIDVSPVSKDMLADIEQGNCDCESPGPWYKVYVRSEDVSHGK